MDDSWIIKFDKNRNVIYLDYRNGNGIWRKFDENNNLIHSKSFNGKESWYKYDKNNKPIRIIKQEFEKIEIKKKEELEYKRKIEKRSYRFEIMEI